MPNPYLNRPTRRLRVGGSGSGSGSAPALPDLGSVQTNVVTTASFGTQLTAHATNAHTKGSYTELISATSFDVYEIEIILTDAAAGATDTGFLVDIATGAAASESVVIANLNGGHANFRGNEDVGGQKYRFPLRIVSGTRIAARCQAVNPNDTIQVGIWLRGGSTAPDFYGSSVTTYGADTAASQGVVVTSGAGAKGNYAEITSATSAEHHFWTWGVAGADNALNSTAYIVDLAKGAAASETDIDANRWVGTLATNEELSMMNTNGFYHTIAASTRLAARAWGDGQTLDVIAYGVTMTAS